MGGLFGVGERDLIHEVPMPEAVGMSTFIEPPHRSRRWRWSGLEGVTNLALKTLHRRGADLKLLAML
jgi:hypothetical protein